MPFLKTLKISVTKSRTEASRRNGLRRAIFTPTASSTRRYTGEWRDDRKHGKGSEFEIQSRLLYEGDWANDARHGYGVLSKILDDKRRRKIYSGHWANGRREGFGGLWYEDGSYYEGDFHGNRRHGFGRMWESDGSFYQGTWKDDLRHGEGMLVLANGNRFEGHFSRGNKEGRGIFHHVRTGQLQMGCWIADTCLASTVEDMYWRQSSAEPTPYPIPKNELKNSREMVESLLDQVSSLGDSSAPTYSENFRDYVSGNIDWS